MAQHAHPGTQEYEHRFKVWLDNLEFIVEYNAQHVTHWVRHCSTLISLCVVSS